MRSIPLYYRGTVVGYALVDDADYDDLAVKRWHRKGETPWDYAARWVRKGPRMQPIFMHREILGLPVGPPRGSATRGHLFVDHINHDTLDNRRENLRSLTPEVNPQNQWVHIVKTSRHRGVYLDRRSGQWIARVVKSGRSILKRRFPTEIDAARAARVEATAS